MIKLIIFLFFIMTSKAFCVEIIAHRGASHYAPENTLSSITKAIELNSPYIEIDIHLTKDNEVVVIHDASVNRTTDGKGEVRDLTLKEIKALDCGSFFSNDFKGEKIPTLEEVMERVSGSNSKLIIEFKYGLDKYPGIESKVISLVSKYKLQDKVILKSFNPKILKKFEELSVTIPRLYVLFGSYKYFTVDNFIRFRSMFDIQNVDYYQVHKYFIREELVKKAHKLNKKIIAWGVEKEDLPELKNIGVDIIETDDPKI